MIRTGSLRKSSSVRSTASNVSDSGAGKALKRKVSELGKGKRKVVKKEPFTIGATSPEKKKKPDKEKEEKILRFLRGEYLAIKADANGEFYLCQVLQHVFDHLEKFRVRWLDKVDGSDDLYTFEHLDDVEVECIITDVKLVKVKKDTYRLKDNEKNKILSKYKKLQRAAAGEDSESEEDEEESEEEEEESDEEDGPSKPKKRKVVKKAKKAVKKATKSKAKKVKKPKAEKKKKEKKEKKEKPKKKTITAEQRRNPNLLLEENTAVKVWHKDPLLESKEKVPFVSTTSHTKLLMRAVKTNDLPLLQNLINDSKQVSFLATPHSLNNTDDALAMAIKDKNEKATIIIMKEMFAEGAKKKSKKRADPTKSLMSTSSTGRYNPRSLGTRWVRAISEGRGSKEGNNALTKDAENGVSKWNYVHEYIKIAMQEGLDRNFIEKIIKAGNTTAADNLFDHLIDAILFGHRKLAAAIAKEMEKEDSYAPQLGFLHRDVLSFETEDLRPFREASLKKKPYSNDGVTPLHCAAINPNVKYLSKLLSVLPEYNLTDRRNRRPIHYAAVCEGTGPLEFLLKKGIDPEEADSRGYTSLHYACIAGRPKNIDVIMKKAKEASEKDDEDGNSDEEGEDEDEEVAKNPNPPSGGWVELTVH